MEDEDIHSGGLSAPHTPLDGFQIFLERILRPINQMNPTCCICFAVLFNWMNRFGMRITALEKKIEEIERHVMIDIDMP